MCEVEDNMDGSYNASCLLPWKGKAIVTAVLIHPSEAIFHLIQKFSSEQEYGLTMNATMRNSENKTEITKCSVGYPTMRFVRYYFIYLVRYEEMNRLRLVHYINDCGFDFLLQFM